MSVSSSLDVVVVMNPVLLTMNTVPCCRAETSSSARQQKKKENIDIYMLALAVSAQYAGVAHLTCSHRRFPVCVLYYLCRFALVAELGLPPSSSWPVGRSEQSAAAPIDDTQSFQNDVSHLLEALSREQKKGDETKWPLEGEARLRRLKGVVRLLT